MPAAAVPKPPMPAAAVPKPPAPAAAAPKPPAPAAPKPATAPPPSVSKKDTAKVQVAPPARPAPQATVKIGSSAPTAAPGASIKTAPQAEATTTEAAPDSLTGILAIAATVMALAALGIQVWMFL
ncbi:MAG: hypothetical protein ACO3XN_05420 [Chthoniobacterales bacterium]|jgi:hypothetical protein